MRFFFLYVFFFFICEQGATDSMSEREYGCWADTSLNPGAAYAFTCAYVIKHSLLQ